MSEVFDLVVRGGTIVDGSGGESYTGDVGVRNGVIAAIAPDLAGGREEVDARGCIVTPGFVDVHTHYDGQITWEHRLAPSSDHGVTTVLMGNCGVGFAPCRPDDRDILVRLMEGVEEIPGIVMAEGVPWNWETFPAYMDALEQRNADIDFCVQLPHSPLRVYVMGERAVKNEPPSDDDLTAMRRLTREAMEAGALGVSTSHSPSHRFITGEPAPSIHTEVKELLALADGLRDAGKGVFQMLGNFRDSASSQFAMFETIAQAAGRPLSFTYAQNMADPDGWRVTLGKLEEAHAKGLEIRGQVLPRPVGILMGLDLLLHAFSFTPSYLEIADLPLTEKVRRMRDPEMRRRLLTETPSHTHPHLLGLVREQDNLYVLGSPPNYNPLPEESLAAIAKSQNRNVREVIYDALLERDGHEIIYRPLGNMAEDPPRFEGVADLLRSPHAIIGLGDGGAHYGTICDAAFTTYFLTYWLSEARSARFDLNEAIRILSHDPAQAVGLRDRGLLKVGYKADINVIDMDRLTLHPPRPIYDLPAGGRRLTQKADGYVATIVSGKITYREGTPTGALPGRLQRFAREAA